MGCFARYVGGMRYRTILVPLAVALLGTAASAAGPDQIGVTMLEQQKKKIPLQLTCPLERTTCVGTASFTARKRRGGRIYELQGGPFEFRKFDGGTTKKIGFRVPREARKVLRKARGMTARFVINARYGDGDRGTVRLRAKLSG
jgi:hypothetical protein